MSLVKNKGLSIRFRITCYAVILTVAALALISALSYTLFRAQLKQSIAKHQAAEIAALAYQVDDRLKQALELLQRLANSITPDEFSDPDRLQRILDREDDARTFFNGGFLVIGADLRLLVDSPFIVKRRGMDYSFREYARRTMETGKSGITDPYRTVLPPNEPQVTFTASIKGADGKAIGLLAGRLNLLKDSFLQSVTKTTISDVGSIYIFSASRTIVVHPKRSRIMEHIKTGVNAGIDRAIQDGFEGSMENVNSKGVPGITSFKRLTNANWIMASDVPISDIYTPLRATEKTVFAAFICIALASALLIWSVLGRMMMPLQNVINHIGLMSIKKGSERFLPDNYEGELGRLTQVFNALIEEFDDQQDALRIAGDTYRIVAEFTAEVAFWRVPDGGIQFISPNCLELTGYPESEFYAQPDLLDSIVHPDYREYWDGHTHEYEEDTGKPLSFDLKIVTGGGGERWVNHLCHQVFNKEGRLLGTRGNFTDITLIRQIQHSLEHEKKFFGSLIQNAAAPIFVIDRNHIIIFWNKAMEMLTGRSPLQMVGTNRQWEPFYPAERPVLADLVIDHKLNTINDFYAIFDISTFSEGDYRAEGWYENLGGKRRYIFFEAAPITNGDNEVLAAIETLEDITDRKLAQESMDRHNSFLQEILDAIPNPVYYKDKNGAYIGCNKAFLVFFGKTAPEVIGKTISEIMPEEYATVSTERDMAIITDQARLNYETELMRYDGLVRSVLVHKAPFSSADGNLGGIVGTFVDISEQRQMNEQFRKMWLAVEQSPSTIVITDTDGRIEYVNPKFCQTTGYTFDEVVDQNPRILKSGEMSQAQYADMWQTITSGREWRGEFHNKRKNGELYWEFASISPQTNNNGDITGFLAVKEDITQRKQFEKELAKSREELQRKHNELSEMFAQVESGKREWEDTMDSLSEMVLMCDQFGVINRCNRAVTTFTRLPYDEVVNVECIELFARVGLEIIGYDGTGGQLEYEGGRRHFELLSNELKQTGTDNIRGVVVTIHETTELFKMNEKLQKAYAELQQTQAQIFQQEKMASIGQLAAGVAHEINNPMGFISSNLSSMGKYMEKINAFESALIEAVQDKGDTETVATLNELRKKMKIDFILEDIKSLLDESRDGAERVRRIVQDLKSFSHVDEAQCKAVSINESLDTTINMLRNEIKYVADVEREYDQDLPMLLCFPQQINQVFMNIIVNAAHAIEGHGIIKIKTLHDIDDIVVRISDTGKGILPENLTRIFEPFFTTKAVGKGTGLGLSISYDIIRKHGGVMNVESEVGAGTTFVIRLPLTCQFADSEVMS
jgi:PAS domain S-box-containing protein